MSLKQILISGYLGISLLFALYGWLLGPFSHKGLAYNLGRAIFWPTIMFPSLGGVLTAVILVGVIAVILLLRK